MIEKNIQDLHDNFKVESCKGFNQTTYYVSYTYDGIDWYDLFEDPDEDICKVIAALLNMYYLNSYDINTLKLDKIKQIYTSLTLFLKTFNLI